ncbi:MAG TPA: hypothetical protein VNT28_02350 [Candidatus Limnocylindrales bacterium]|jgi:hypothetical protein|nr:hypothetical protein [Candidatus Limnocylindrales bacterium]
MYRPVALLGLMVIIFGCASPGPTAPPSPSPTPSPSPSPTPGAQGLYLRAWQTQALPPEHTFGWLPTLTISDGLAIDGNVAIPMIFPGPLLIMPNVREISPEGQAAIAQLARDLGLLGGATDFTGGGLAPGGITAHVVLTIDGQSVQISGDPNATGRCAPGDLRCQPEPATPEAFAFFWARLGYLDDWLGAELSGNVDYTPDRLAVAATPPSPIDVPHNEVAWPLETPFADFGQPWTMAESRCAVVEGSDLELLLPALMAANQATLFVDGNDEPRTVIARVLVPGEPSVCGD